MDIIWLGHSCFRLRGRDATVLIDPYANGLNGQSLARQTVDLALISNEHPNHANLGALEGSPPVLRGAGEYEIKGVLVTGLDTHLGRSETPKPRNTAYTVEIDEVTICHLGDLTRPLNASQKEHLGSVDVLLVPVGSNCTIDAVAAAETISVIEPKVAIPMHYGVGAEPGGLEPLDRFLKEMGLTEVQVQPRLNATKSNLPETTQVVVLESRR